MYFYLPSNTDVHPITEIVIFTRFPYVVEQIEIETLLLLHKCAEPFSF